MHVQLIKETQSAIEDARSSLAPLPCAILIRKTEALVKAFQELHEDYIDWKGNVAYVMGEECPSEDTMLVHCTCVPRLREEVRRLREELGDRNKGM